MSSSSSRRSSSTSTPLLVIPYIPVLVSDSGRFPHRGVMVDSSRHFLPVSTLLNVLDAMSADKLNVLHWHLTDAQSWPIASQVFPQLAMHSAYSPLLAYDHHDLQLVVNYAYDRGIRVVPEFDSPAHTQALAATFPHLFPTNCTIDYYTVLDPVPSSSSSFSSSTSTTAASDPADVYEFWQQFFGEMSAIFVDEYWHLGGDEVNFPCWNQSQNILQWMKQQGIADGDFKAVTRFYIEQVQQIAVKLGKSPIQWQETLDHYGPGEATPSEPNKQLVNQTVIQMWFYPGWNWFNMTDVVTNGLRGIKSDGWYIDEASTWTAFYTQDPLTNGTCNYTTWECGSTNEWPIYNITDPVLVKAVLGGEACVWGERADGDNLMVRTWPVMSSVGERLWSEQIHNDVVAATPRMRRHVCRLKARGLPVSPFEPGFC